MNLDKLAQYLHGSYCDPSCKSWAADRENAGLILRATKRTPTDTATAYRAGYEKGKAETQNDTDDTASDLRAQIAQKAEAEHDAYAKYLDGIAEAEYQIEQARTDLEVARHELIYLRTVAADSEAAYVYANRMAQAYAVRNHHLETRNPGQVPRPDRGALQTTQQEEG